MKTARLIVISNHMNKKFIIVKTEDGQYFQMPGGFNVSFSISPTEIDLTIIEFEGVQFITTEYVGDPLDINDFIVKKKDVTAISRIKQGDRIITIERKKKK